MIRIGEQLFEQPESPDETDALVDEFSKWFFEKYLRHASSTFAHIVIDDYNLDDSYIHWCVEWEQVRRWIDDEMEGIDEKNTIYTQIALREEILEKAQVVIRFLLDLTTIPEELR